MKEKTLPLVMVLTQSWTMSRYWQQ